MPDVPNDQYKNDNKSLQKEKFDFYEIDSARTSQSFSVNITINLSDRTQCNNNMILFNDSKLDN